MVFTEFVILLRFCTLLKSRLTSERKKERKNERRKERIKKRKLDSVAHSTYPRYGPTHVPTSTRARRRLKGAMCVIAGIEPTTIGTLRTKVVRSNHYTIEPPPSTLFF